MAFAVTGLLVVSCRPAPPSHAISHRMSDPDSIGPTLPIVGPRGAWPVVPEGLWSDMMVAVDFDTPRPTTVTEARARASEYLGYLARNTGVLVPPLHAEDEWEVGLLASDPIDERLVEGGYQFAFPFACPERPGFARVVEVRGSGEASLMYPPVEMPGWRAFSSAPAADREIPAGAVHPELIGVWLGRAREDEFGELSRCSGGPFAYDGRSVTVGVASMRPDWWYRDEDDLTRVPARWRGSTLQVRWHEGGAWEDLAVLRDERSFVAVSEHMPPCLLESVREPGSADLTSWLASFTRLRPLRSRERGRQVAPMHSTLPEYLCRSRAP